MVWCMKYSKSLLSIDSEYVVSHIRWLNLFVDATFVSGMEMHISKVNHVGLKTPEDILKERIIITKPLDIISVVITTIITEEVSLGKAMQRDIREKNHIQGRERLIIIMTVIEEDGNCFIERCGKQFMKEKLLNHLCLDQSAILFVKIGMSVKT